MAFRTLILCVLPAVAVVGCSGGNATDSALPGEQSAPPAATASSIPIHWTIDPVMTALTAGGTDSVQIEAAIDSGWHIYAVTQPAPGPSGGPIATHITLPPNQPFTMTAPARPTTEPETKYDDAFGMNVQLHDASVGFVVPITTAATAPSGVDSIHVNVRYQVCNARLCYPPQTSRLVAPATVKG